MKVWAACKGDESTGRLELAPWRVVEAQHISSTRDLVDNRAEHDVLEQLLEESKPPIETNVHYLIFTPFRYPPLKYGSRFGGVHEPSLWYGSFELSTALAEVAYYRLKFFQDSTADLGYIEIPMTAFVAYIDTQKGVDLTLYPFKAFQNKISDRNSYAYSQSLGTNMRQANIQAFIFASARTINNEKNIAAFTPVVFKKKKNQYISNMQNWRCLASKETIEFTRYDRIKEVTKVYAQVDFV